VPLLFHEDPELEEAAVVKRRAARWAATVCLHVSLKNARFVGGVASGETQWGRWDEAAHRQGPIRWTSKSARSRDETTATFAFRRERALAVYVLLLTSGTLWRRQDCWYFNRNIFEKYCVT